ncbi:MAG TPA: MFS transporter, partial [Chthoniobacterales bacterium]
IYAPVQLVVGWSLDRFGAKRVLVPAILLCAAGCFLEAFGITAWMLTSARLLQGFGSAFAFVGAMYLATKWFPANKLALLAGLTTALGMLGAIGVNAGLVEIVQDVGWRSTLWGAGIAGIGVAALVFWIVPHDKPRNAEGLGEAVEEEVHSLWKSLRVVGGNPQTWLAAVVATALYMPLTLLGALWGVEYVATVTQEGKVQASGAISMIYVGWLIFGPFTGWLSDRWGRRKLLVLASSVLTLLASGLLLLFTNVPLWAVYGLMLLIGIASSPQTVSFVMAVEHNPRSMSGTAIAVVNMLVMLLGGLCMPLFGCLLELATPGHGEVYSPTAYRLAMILLPASMMLSILACVFLKESRHCRKLPDYAEPMG